MDNKEQVDEQKKVIGAYQYIFKGLEGEIVLNDLRRMSGIDEPFCLNDIPDDRTLLHRAVWQDAFNYIQAMTKGEIPDGTDT